MKLAAALPSSLLNGYNPLGLRKSPRWCGCLRFAVSLQQAVELCHRALVAGSLSACTQFVHSRAALCRTIAGCVSLIKILFDVHLGPHRGGMHLRWATLVPLPHYNFVGRISSNIEVGAESINFAAHFHYQPTFLSSYLSCFPLSAMWVGHALSGPWSLPLQPRTLQSLLVHQGHEAPASSRFPRRRFISKGIDSQGR